VDTDSVLSEIGWSEERIGALQAAMSDGQSGTG
jgi:hypothetical protein